jgi:glycosyltransferase involved in cell wall biosynthesis
MIDKKEISIVTIVLNQRDLIEKTILSVLSQESVQIEYIIIDGGSSDGTLEIINKYSDKIFKLISEPDEGIYDAINKGISLCSCSIIGLIHCGDTYKSNSLSRVYLDYLQNDSDVLYGDIDIEEDLGSKKITFSAKAEHKMLLNKMSIYHPSTFVKLASYKRYGVYDVTYKSSADYELFIRLFLQNCTFHHINQSLATFNKNGVSSTNHLLSIKENARIKNKYFGVFNAFSYLMFSISSHFYFNARKQLFIKIFGQEKYFKLKMLKYKSND